MDGNELDRVLARAAADLERAIPVTRPPDAAPSSRSASATWGRVAAAAVALVGIGAVAGFAGRGGAGRDTGDTPPALTSSPTPTEPAVASTSAETNVSTVPAPRPSTEMTSNTITPEGEPVGFAYGIPEAVIPDGYRMVAAYDAGVGGGASQAPVFHGIAVMLDDRGLPASPVVHVEVFDQRPTMQGTSTPVEVNGIAGEYVVWDQQFINMATSPTADVRWQLPSGKWLVVSGPSLDFLLLQVARSAQIDDSGAVAVTPPEGMTYLPSWTEFSHANGAGVVYEGPALATLSVTVQRTDDPIVLFALKNYIGSNLTVRNGAPALEFSASRGLASISYEPEPGVRVQITHSTPQTVRDLDARLPLDRATIEAVVDSLERIEDDAWTSLQHQMAAGYERRPSTFAIGGAGDAEVSLTGAVPIPVTALDGSTEHTIPVQVIRSIDGYYRLSYGDADGPGSINLGAAPGISAFRGGGSTEPSPVLIEAGPAVEQLTMIRPNGDRIPVALAELSPDLLPGTRYGYVDVNGEDVQLEARSPGGTVTATPLSQL